MGSSRIERGRHGMMPVNTPPHQPHDRIRLDARLDATTRAKIDDLAKHFHQPRASVLSYIMEWGLSRGQTGILDGRVLEGPVRHLYLYVDTALHARVEKVASASGVKTAPWLCSVVRQITLTEFPVSWQEATLEERSHDSRTYSRRFMLRLDAPSETKLQQLKRQFGASNAHIIRQLIIQATFEDFPKSWHRRSTERFAQQARPDHSGSDRESKP
jgi:hypothetical protein